MSSSTTGATAGRAVTRPRVRHGFLAAALLAVAGLRLAGHDVVWAAVLGAACLVEAGLAVAAHRSGPGFGQASRARRGTGQDVDLPRAPSATVLERSLLARVRAQRLWTTMLLGCTAGAVAVVLSEPTIAAVLAVLALVCLHRVRRERRSVATLRRLAPEHDRTGRPA